MNYFLGIDGGQSHTTALVADARGHIRGRGQAGEANHTRAPGGQARLTKAVNQAVSEALQSAGLLRGKTAAEFQFTSAHLALTGEPEGKQEIVQKLLRAEQLTVGHDAPGALAGALAGGEGVIVVSGTGSVACGELLNAKNERRYVRIGGHGYLFSDEGSAFAIARAAVAEILRCTDRGARADKLQQALHVHFKGRSAKAVAEDFYAGSISREQLASYAARVATLAERSDPAARALVEQAADTLAEMAEAVARKLDAGKTLTVSYNGGMFRSKKLLTRFSAELAKRLPKAQIVAPRFGPDIGALLLAYRQAGQKLTPGLLRNLAEAPDAAK